MTVLECQNDGILMTNICTQSGANLSISAGSYFYSRRYRRVQSRLHSCKHWAVTAWCPFLTCWHLIIQSTVSAKHLNKTAPILFQSNNLWYSKFHFFTPWHVCVTHLKVGKQLRCTSLWIRNSQAFSHTCITECYSAYFFKHSAAFLHLTTKPGKPGTSS